jgi:steroid delta-isomerase-like uncharacterized protein
MANPNVAAALHWFEEVWNRKSLTAIKALMPARCVLHTDNGTLRGSEAFSRLHAEFIAFMPDVHFKIEAAIGEGELVAIRWLVTGTHSGTGFGQQPTGSRVEVRGCTWHRYENGMIVEAWDFYDVGRLFRSATAV